MKKAALLIIISVLVFALAACAADPVPSNNSNNSANTDNSTVKPEDVAAMKYSEYMAAAENSNVVIEGYVQKYAYNKEYHKVSMFICDDDGAYYAYGAACSEEQASKLAEGIHVKVSGKKSSWSGETEIGEGCIFYILEGSRIYDAVDISGKLSQTAELEKMMNQKIRVSGLLVEASTDAEGNPASFLYNWDGSGKKGAGSDLYFSLSEDGKAYSFCVESDEDAEGSEVYSAVTSLNIGDIIDLEGMLYWYNGPNVHVSRVNVAKASKADTQKGEGVLTYAQYMECADEAEAVVEAYVQGKSVYNEEKGSFSLYLADADGGYFAKNVSAPKEDYDKLSKGSKIRLTGTKTFSGDLPMIGEGSTMELLEGYYISSAVNATAKLADSEALKTLIARSAVLRGLKLAGSKATGSDEEKPFLYNSDGSGKPGENCDIYFTVATADGQTFVMRVDSSLHPEGSEVYASAEALGLGDELNLECFISWADGPEFLVQKISVKR